VVDVTFRPD